MRAWMLPFSSRMKQSALAKRQNSTLNARGRSARLQLAEHAGVNLGGGLKQQGSLQTVHSIRI